MHLSVVRFFSLIILLCLGPLTGFSQNNTSSYFRLVKQNSVDFTIRYYDSTSLIKSVKYHDHKIVTVIGFYRSQVVKYIDRGTYVDTDEDLFSEAVNQFNSLFRLDQNSLSYSAFSGCFDSFFPNANKRTELIAVADENLLCKYLEYYLNGKVKKEMYFKHYSLDSLFVPYGTWFEFDSTGTETAKYLAPNDYVPENIDF